MKRYLMATVMVITLPFLWGCSGGGPEKADGGGTSSGSVAEAPGAANKLIKLYPEIKEERKLQQSADNGWQVWRKNPLDVAHAALIAKGVDVRIEDCAVVEEQPKHCAVKASGDGYEFLVHLSRIVRDDGIWSATAIEVLKEPHRDAAAHDH